MNAEIATPAKNFAEKRPKLTGSDRAMFRNAIRLIRGEITVQRFDELERRLEQAKNKPTERGKAPMAVNLNPDTFTKTTDPLELEWIRYEWITAYLDARGLGDAIPFVLPPDDPNDWRSAVRGVEVAAHGVARNEIPELCGELERLKTSALLSNDPPEPANGPLYLDADEVARRLGLPSAAKVYDLARRGAIGCSRFGKYVRFSAEDVGRYESESKRRPKAGYLPAVDLGALPPPPVPGSATTRRRAGSGRKPFKPQF